MNVAVTLSPRDYDVVLFDLDRVLTRTASVHAAAWQRLFDGFLEQRATKAGTPFVPFDIEVRGDVLHLAPELPQEMERLDMRIRYRGHSLDLRLTRDSLTIRGRDDAAPITVCVDGEVCEFVGGTTRVIRLNDDATDVGTHRD